MGLIKFILVLWLLIGRFLFTDDTSFGVNLTAMTMVFFLLKFHDSKLTRFTLIITLSIFFTSLIKDLPGANVVGMLSALISYAIGFKPQNKWIIS